MYRTVAFLLGSRALSLGHWSLNLYMDEGLIFLVLAYLFHEGCLIKKASDVDGILQRIRSKCKQYRVGVNE